jgi:hypothetical protein
MAEFCKSMNEGAGGVTILVNLVEPDLAMRMKAPRSKSLVLLQAMRIRKWPGTSSFIEL